MFFLSVQFYYVVFLSVQFYYTLSLFLLLEVVLAVCFFLTYYVQDVKDFLFPQDAFNKAIVHYRDDRDMQDLIDSLQSAVSTTCVFSAAWCRPDMTFAVDWALKTKYLSIYLSTFMQIN